MNAAAQWSAIGAMILCGLAMGTAFDVFRVASHRFHVARWLLPGLDVVYWAAATFLVFSLLLDSNHGEVRMYVFLGLGIGVTGYFGLFSGTVMKLTAWLIDRLRQLAMLLWKIGEALAYKPVRWIVLLIAKLIDVAFVVTAAIVLWTLRLVLKPFVPLGKWGWRKLRPARDRVREWCGPFVKAYLKTIEKGKEVARVFRKK